MPDQNIPSDYDQRVYAGVLGKIIGVYLGRPFEGWDYAHIMRELGEVQYYVHERLNKPLIVTDDDISGTFTFFRALEDFNYSRDLSAAQIGQTWLNYIIEGRTILWWGGMGVSTEHTAFARMKRGIPAPRSGSIALNGKVVAEQIGAQIFIDGWGMAAPGDPELAADLAKKAGSVSHDGEAVYGGQVIAAMEAQAFVETDLNKLFDTGVRFIPKDCTIRRLIDDIRDWRGKDNDWRQTRERIQAKYGYDKFGGGCHIVPNHAVIVLALLYGKDNFQKSLMIANTAGWDTDCNSGNVGCIMGIKLGLAGIGAGPDWRGPVADRLYLPTADGGRCITDAVSEALAICRAGRKLAGQEPVAYKNGAKFHFELPGSVQGFTVEDSAESRDTARAENAAGHSRCGSRSLAIHYRGVSTGRSARVGTPTFMPKAALEMPGYSLYASPTLYSGQVLRAAIEADSGNAAGVTVRPYVRCYGADDQLQLVRGADATLSAGGSRVLDWRIPDTDGPIADAGIEIASEVRSEGAVYLDYLTWSGAPDVTFGRPKHNGSVWSRAWVNAADYQNSANPELPHRIAGEEGHRLIIQGTREWRDYAVSAGVRPHLAAAAGIAACVQGLQRYYALVLCPGNKIRLLKQHYGVKLLAEAGFNWSFGDTVTLSLATKGAQLIASANGKQIFKLEDVDQPLLSGAIALLVEAGRVDAGPVRVAPF